MNKEDRSEKGRLWLVATPIGNLNDFSSRGADTLSNADQIACEDTRVTKKLLDHLSIRKPLVSYREENERVKSVELAELVSPDNLLHWFLMLGIRVLAIPVSV